MISGAGLGGLVLAQALRAHADVVVLERDRSPLDTGGYRIALTPQAVAVLDRHVPPELLARIRAVSDTAASFSQLTIADRRMRPIVVAPEPPGEDRMLCQRRALRVLLLDGLGDAVRFDAPVAAAHAHAAGATVELADGSLVHGDVVVAADGARSPVVRAQAGGPSSRDLRLTGIAGSTPLAGGGVPAFLDRGPAIALDHRGTGLFLSLASRGVRDVPAELVDAVGPPSLVWGLIAPAGRVPEALSASVGRLVRMAADATARWHPWVTGSVERSDLDRVAAFAFRSASTSGPRFPWPLSRVTALGDAVHAMPPTGGRAGSTAILDAGWLADCLIADPGSPERAIAAYQARVDEWAIPAIEESLQPVRVLRALEHGAVSAIARPALAIAGAIGRRGARASTRRSPTR